MSTGERKNENTVGGKSENRGGCERQGEMKVEGMRGMERS